MMTFPILTSIVALPAVGALLLLLVRDERNEPLVRNTALVVSVLVFAETVLLAWQFNPASPDFQFVERHAWIPAFGISYAVGVDGISLWLVVLTGFLTPIALLSAWESVHRKTRAFCMMVLLLESAMLGVFVSFTLSAEVAPRDHTIRLRFAGCCSIIGNPAVIRSAVTNVRY